MFQQLLRRIHLVFLSFVLAKRAQYTGFLRAKPLGSEDARRPSPFYITRLIHFIFPS